MKNIYHMHVSPDELSRVVADELKLGHTILGCTFWFGYWKLHIYAPEKLSTHAANSSSTSVQSGGRTGAPRFGNSSPRWMYEKTA